MSLVFYAPHDEVTVPFIDPTAMAAHLSLIALAVACASYVASTGTRKLRSSRCCSGAKLMLIRGPLDVDSFGTQWHQSRWARPPITIRSPEAGRNVAVRPPHFGRIRKRRLAPSVRTGTILSDWTRPMLSPCHAVESCSSR